MLVHEVILHVRAGCMAEEAWNEEWHEQVGWFGYPRPRFLAGHWNG